MAGIARSRNGKRLARTKRSRAIAAASAVAALAFTAACGGGGDEDKGTDAKPLVTARSSAAEEKTDSAGQGALTEAQLEKAALADGDVKEYEIAEKSAAEMPAETVPANPAACQPLANMFYFTSDPNAEARVGRTLTDKTDLTGTVVTTALLAYARSDAEKLMADLRTATKNCATYEQVGNKYSGIEALTAPKRGDEAVSYKLKGDIEGTSIPMSFTIVRSGSTLAAFYAMNLLDAEKAQVPESVLEAQLAKLEKATA